MTSTSPSAFLLSATLHAVVLGLMLLFHYAVKLSEPEPPRILELVAGAGDDYMAKEAPALGTEGGIKVPIAKQPEPQPIPTPPPPAPVAPPPPTPKAPPVSKAVEPETPDFQKKLKQVIRAADNKAKREIAKERAAEKKREEEEKKRISKEQFDRENRSKTKTVASAAPKSLAVKKIDVEGIAGGVVGGSSASKKGAGGKALTSDNEDVLAAYYGLFKQELRKKFEPPPGLADSLKVEIEVRSNPDGTMTGARVAKSSGSREFDQSVLEAIRRVKMPVRPDRKSETIQFTFSMLDRGEG